LVAEGISLLVVALSQVEFCLWKWNWGL